MNAERIRVGFVQTRAEFGAVSSNLERVRRLIDAGPECELLVLPELFSSGYLFRDRSEAMQLAETEAGPTLRALRSLAKRTKSWIAGGFAERAGDHLYNSAALVGPGGSSRVYRKIHLFDRETEIFDAGDRPFEAWEIETQAGTVRVGLMICFDWVFPESARCLALGGAEVILHPANLVLPHCQDAMRTRCLENRVYAVTANRSDADDRGELRLEFTGRSQIVDPRGEVRAQASEDGEELAVETIELALARDKRITPRNELLRDRRPERYPNLL